MDLGYCQGMNFISYYLMKMDFSEEQVFWIMDYCFEYLVPKNYYINMIPLIADIKVFKYILKESLPKIYKVMQTLKIDLNFIVVSWFLLIFVEINNFELQHVIFSQFLIDGVTAYYKVCLIVFEECSESLKKTKSLSDFQQVLRGHLKNYPRELIPGFAQKLNKLFMNSFLLN